MKIAVVGGGPAGLQFAATLKQKLPNAFVDVFERNAAGVAFGFGVVFSEATQRGLAASDSLLQDVLDEEGVRWDALEVSLRGERFAFAGNGMGAVLRATLLARLQHSARDAGVHLHFSTPVSREDLTDYDIIVAADGANSSLRAPIEDRLGVSYEHAKAKFIWFATPFPFDGLTFVHAEAEGVTGAPGIFAAHAYPIGGGLSTFIVETDAATWSASGMDQFDPATPPGVSDTVSQQKLEQIFASHIDGAPLVANNSRWANFRTIRAEKWHDGNVVFLGDAVHTAHFSVGSGTKMALEDAVALAEAIAESPGDPESAFREYEERRMPSVRRIQDAARPSLSWWEHFGDLYRDVEPWQFAFNFFSRSIGLAKIRRRDPEAARSAEDSWYAQHGADPLESPLSLAGEATSVDLPRRVIDNDMLSDLSVRYLSVPTGEGDVRDSIESVFSGPGQPTAVVVHGGTAFTRTLAAEEVRLRRRTPTLVVEPGCDDDTARTLILSGRADAVVR